MKRGNPAPLRKSINCGGLSFTTIQGKRPLGQPLGLKKKPATAKKRWGDMKACVVGNRRGLAHQTKLGGGTALLEDNRDQKVPRKETEEPHPPPHSRISAGKQGPFLPVFVNQLESPGGWDRGDSGHRSNGQTIHVRCVLNREPPIEGGDSRC